MSWLDGEIGNLATNTRRLIACFCSLARWVRVAPQCFVTFSQKWNFLSLGESENTLFKEKDWGKFQGHKPMLWGHIWYCTNSGLKFWCRQKTQHQWHSSHWCHSCKKKTDATIKQKMHVKIPEKSTICTLAKLNVNVTRLIHLNATKRRYMQRRKMQQREMQRRKLQRRKIQQRKIRFVGEMVILSDTHSCGVSGPA